MRFYFTIAIQLIWFLIKGPAREEATRSRIFAVENFLSSIIFCGLGAQQERIIENVTSFYKSLLLSVFTFDHENTMGDDQHLISFADNNVTDAIGRGAAGAFQFRLAGGADPIVN
jgi:hypothetical protein